eukprot:gene910-1425_t
MGRVQVEWINANNELVEGTPPEFERYAGRGGWKYWKESCRVHVEGEHGGEMLRPWFTRQGKYYGDKVLEHHVEVYWPLENKWFKAQVTGYTKMCGKHELLYDDGFRESCHLCMQTLRWQSPVPVLCQRPPRYVPEPQPRNRRETHTSGTNQLRGPADAAAEQKPAMGRGIREKRRPARLEDSKPAEAQKAQRKPSRRGNIPVKAPKIPRLAGSVAASKQSCRLAMRTPPLSTSGKRAAALAVLRRGKARKRGGPPPTEEERRERRREATRRYQQKLRRAKLAAGLELGRGKRLGAGICKGTSTSQLSLRDLKPTLPPGWSTGLGWCVTKRRTKHSKALPAAKPKPGRRPGAGTAMPGGGRRPHGDSRQQAGQAKVHKVKQRFSTFRVCRAQYISKAMSILEKHRDKQTGVWQVVYSPDGVSHQARRGGEKVPMQCSMDPQTDYVQVHAGSSES